MRRPAMRRLRYRCRRHACEQFRKSRPRSAHQREPQGSPLPLVGRGWGWGEPQRALVAMGRSAQVWVRHICQLPPCFHPTPNPSPSRGGEWRALDRGRNIGTSTKPICKAALMAETSAASNAVAPEPIPVVRADYVPVLLVPVLAAAAYPLIGNPTTWVTLTVAALAMGMMIFVIASGLTLVFGLMDVLNFGHGAFIAVGAYLAMTTLIPLAGWMQADSLALNLAALGLAILAAMVGTGILGWAFERVIIMPVYGQHLKQILITTGGMIVADQMDHVVWAPNRCHCRSRRLCVARSPSATWRSRNSPDRGRGRRSCSLAMFLVLNRSKARTADPRRRRERRDGRSARLPHPRCSSASSSPVGAGRTRRRASGACTPRR